MRGITVLGDLEDPDKQRWVKQEKANRMEKAGVRLWSIYVDQAKDTFLKLKEDGTYVVGWLGEWEIKDRVITCYTKVSGKREIWFKGKMTDEAIMSEDGSVFERQQSMFFPLPEKKDIQPTGERKTAKEVMKKDTQKNFPADSSLMGELSVDSDGKIYLLPLAAYGNGKYRSAFGAFGEEEIKSKRFWLYEKGILVGQFEATGIARKMVFSGEEEPVVAGRAFWEQGRQPKIPRVRTSNLRLLEDIVALSHPIPQPFWQDKSQLNQRQISGLLFLLHDTIGKPSASLSEKLKKEGRYCKGLDQKDFGNPQYRIIIMDLDQDGKFEVYATAKWPVECGGKYPITNIFATWMGDNWLTLRHSTYFDWESLPAVGESPFSIAAVADMDGDGLAELVVSERKEYERSELALYQLRRGRLVKVLDIGSYGF